MQNAIEPILFQDPQTEPHKSCPLCRGAVYPPGYCCIRCAREYI